MDEIVGVVADLQGELSEPITAKIPLFRGVIKIPDACMLA